MKTMKSKIVMKAFIVFSVLMMSIGAIAQPPDPLEDDPGVPLDGGLSILIAAGVGYGAKKIHDARKKNKNASDYSDHK